MAEFITGTVTDSETGDPIEGATITVVDADTYEVTAEEREYDPATATVTLGTGDTARQDFALDPREYKAKGELNADYGFGVVGRNTAASGRPIGVRGTVPRPTDRDRRPVRQESRPGRAPVAGPAGQRRRDPKDHHPELPRGEPRRVRLLAVRGGDAPDPRPGARPAPAGQKQAAGADAPESDLNDGRDRRDPRVGDKDFASAGPIPVMGDQNGRLPADTAVGRVRLRAADPDELAAFYRDVVGLSVRSDEDDRIRLGAGGTTLVELLADPDVGPRPADATGLFHLAIRVPSRAALGAALSRLEDRWHLEGASDHLVSEALYASDPEGNGVEVYRDRPRAEWPTGEEGRVGMETRPLDLDPIRSAAGGADRERVPPGTTVGHVHLEGSSIPRARAFYVDALGLSVRQTYGDDALFLAAGDYHHHVGVNVWNGRSAPPSGRGLERFELLVPGDRALGAVRERLENAGVDPSTSSDGGFAVEDPDGIALLLRSTADDPDP